MKCSARACALILCAALMISLSGCGIGSSSSASSGGASGADSGNNAPLAANGEFCLPVILSQSLNPLTTTSIYNLSLWPLMYDCLSEPDQNYNPVMRLASSIDTNGLTVTVKLKTGVEFTDGTSLSAQDVVYSYNLVKATPTSFFYSNTANIASVQASGSNTVIFSLYTPDTLFANLLTIPIIKNGTANSNSNFTITGINVPPTGSGRYIFFTDSVSGTLTYNTKWYGASEPIFNTIKLVNLLNGNTALSNLKIGSINYLLTDYGDGAQSAAGLSFTSFPLNRMVFVGVNAAKAGLSNANIRGAISMAIDRNSLVTNAFSSRANATNLPFNPSWAGCTQPASSQLSANVSTAQSTLAALGLTGNSGGALSGTIDGVSVKLNYRLLVDSSDSALLAAAKEIASNLSNAGISITVDPKAPDAYNSKLAANDFDLYIAQINLNDDMDLSAFFSAGGAASYGISSAGVLSAYNAWRSGTGTADAFCTAFTKDFPFIPLCFKNGTVSYKNGLTGTIAPTYYDLFNGIGDWHYTSS